MVSSMPVYRIHRLRESRRQQFRWAPHTSGASVVRPNDYEEGATVEAETPYAAWLALRGAPEALQPGDILANESGELRIYKYVGFEDAKWFVPEPAPAPPQAEAAVQ